MRRTLLAFFISLAALSLAKAQDETEALRFSRTFHVGSARFAAMGGAFAAVGADLATLNFNPAGIGQYRASEFVITPSFKASHSVGSYLGNNTSDNNYNVALSNIGGVANFDMYKHSGLLHLNFGFAYNQTVDFDNRIAVRQNGATSNRLMDYFALLANSHQGIYTTNDADQFLGDEAWMAYNAFVINDVPKGEGTDSIKGFEPAINKGQGVNYNNRSHRWGSMGEYSFSVGGNISNMIYFGATIGITSILYNESMTETEQSLDRTTSLQFYNYERQFRTTGTGYNAKVGVILWPFINTNIPLLRGIRAGAAIHTPTVTRLTDRYTADMRSNIESAWINTNIFTYGLESPSKTILGLAHVVGSPTSPFRYVVSLDWEYVDYSRIRMREINSWGSVPGESVVDMNDHISSEFRSVSNIRVGAELGIKKLAFRAGFAYYPSPYRNVEQSALYYSETNTTGPTLHSNTQNSPIAHLYSGGLVDGAVAMYSTGLGIQTSPRFAINMAYRLSVSTEEGYLYRFTGTNIDGEKETVESGFASYNIKDHMFLLSLNWRF